MNEVWKPIEGFGGAYEVSTLGRVRSHKVNNSYISNNWDVSVEKILAPQLMYNGYLYVDLCKNGKRVRKNIHRLVAETFLPAVSGKEFINHIDENKQNNCLDNLEWCTCAENSRHSAHKLRGKIRFYKRSNTGEHHISKRKDGYYSVTVKINGESHVKIIKTLENAIAYRDSLIGNEA